MSDRLVTAHIDLEKYAHNLTAIRSRVGKDVAIMAVIKANAYGHGIVEIAQTAIEQGVRYLGVVCLYEARQLRSAGVTHPIMLINYLDPASCGEALDLDLTITVMDADVIRRLEKLSKECGVITKIHLKVDTGMHRSGCDPHESSELIKIIKSSEHLVLEGIFTHFASSDDPDQTHMHEQLRCFNDVLKEIRKLNIHPPLIHAANSAALLTDPATHFTMVRPGIVTYGINPLPKNHPQYDEVLHDFLPILELKSQIVHIRTLGIGEHIGYGSAYTTTKNSEIALIPIGYGDGLMRYSKSARHMLVSGKKASLVGRVSMDQSCIDVTNIDAKVGDEVVVIGSQGTEQITATELAGQSDTIDYEVLTGIMPRVTRSYSR